MIAHDRRAEVATALVSILAKLKRVSPVGLLFDDHDDFLRQMGMDSIDAVDLTLELDATFEVGFGREHDDVDHLTSFGGLVDLVLARGRLEVLDDERFGESA